MANLVPVKRMNKNGVLVTKHVRPESSDNSDSHPLPAPAIGSQQGTTGSQTPQQPEGKFVSMEDFAALSKALELCGSHNSGDNIEHLRVHIDNGDMRAIRVFAHYGEQTEYTLIQDVLYATIDSQRLYEDDEELAGSDTFDAHMKAAESGIDYYDGSVEIDGIVRTIHENPQEVDSIINFVNERGQDAEALTEYLNSAATSLRDGSL